MMKVPASPTRPGATIGILVAAGIGVLIAVWGHPVQSIAGAVVVLAVLSALQGRGTPRSFSAALGEDALRGLTKLLEVQGSANSATPIGEGRERDDAPDGDTSVTEDDA